MLELGQVILTQVRLGTRAMVGTTDVTQVIRHRENLTTLLI
jgi:hypothetical protein